MALNSPDDTISAFFAIFTSGGTRAQKVQRMMALFCGDQAGPPPIPAVGITHHGPNFSTVAEVTRLWGKFFEAFDNFMIQPAQLTLPGQAIDIEAPRLYSRPPYPPTGNLIPMAGVQTILSGDFHSDWFKKPHAGVAEKDHSSKPLSDIAPVSVGDGGPLSTKLPAFVVFAFDPNTHLIIHLWMYLDRYKMWHELQPGGPAMLTGFNEALLQRKHVLDELKRRRGKSE